MISTVPARQVGSGRRITWKKARQILGFLYVLPTLVYVTFFFFLPLALVGWMSLHQCGLLTCTVPNPGPVNFPDNYASISDNDLFWPAVLLLVPCGG